MVRFHWKTKQSNNDALAVVSLADTATRRRSSQFDDAVARTQRDVVLFVHFVADELAETHQRFHARLAVNVGLAGEWIQRH